jgi:hypothetical protein
VATSFRKFLEGLRIIPKTASTASEKGDLDVTDSSGKLNYHNGSSASPVVTEDHSATLTNKTLTSPVLNTPTADTITGIAGGALTIQSASNEDLSLQAQGSGSVSLEALTIDGNTVTGGVSTLTIQSDTDQSIIVQSQGTGNLTLQAAGSGLVQLEDISISANTVTGGASALTIQSASNQNLSLQAQGSGVVQLESLSVDANTVTGGAAALVIQSASNQNLSLQAQGSGTVLLESLSVDANTITGGASTLTIQSASNQNLSLQAQGSGTVSVEGVAFDATTLSTSSNNNLTLSPNGTGSIVATSKVQFNIQTDSTTTGANATVSTVSKSYIELTNGSLTSLDGVVAGGDGQRLVITNRTGSSISVNNETGATAANRILTGTGGAITVSNNASIELIYNTSNSRWMTVGSAGGNARVASISTSTVLTIINDVVLASAASGAINVTLPAPASGKIITVKKTDSTANLVSILPSASETIDGTSLKAITGQYDSVQLVSDGTNWFII